MSKRITTRWYIDAWMVSLTALIAMIALSRGAQMSSSPPTGVLLAYVVVGVAGIVALVMWIAVLTKLAQQYTWGWFAAVLILHLVGLGIVGMVVYAVAGPDDETGVVMRPTVT